jgi:DNA replication protein DnaC
MNNSKNQLENNLTLLRLPTIKAVYSDVSHRALQDSLTYEQYLLEISNLECEARYNNKVERYRRESKLPDEKTFENFDLKRLPVKTQQMVASLREGSFLSRKENVLAFGNPGTGKTHLLCALAENLIWQGKRVLFSTCSDIVQNLLKAKQELRLPRTLKTYDKFDAVLIDDIGYVQQSREEMEVLFELFATRYERASVMITSNLPFSRWEKIFKDPMTTAAVIDRLVHHCVILELNLKSYRRQTAENRNNNS